MNFDLHRDDTGRAFARPILEAREYESFLDCTTVSAAFGPALKQPLPWAGGLLMGPAGTGKSYRAIQEMASALQAGSPAKFLSVPRYVTERREVQFAPHDGRADLLDSVARVKYLVLDDLGAENPNDGVHSLEAKATLRNLLDRRYGDSLPTLVTTNLSTQDLVRIYGDAVFSRICGLGPQRELDGTDRRLPL